MTTNGPYTTSDNLSFAPLKDFLSMVIDENPDVVILVHFIK